MTDQQAISKSVKKNFLDIISFFFFYTFFKKIFARSNSDFTHILPGENEFLLRAEFGVNIE